jgi:hypothetical protein
MCFTEFHFSSNKLAISAVEALQKRLINPIFYRIRAQAGGLDEPAFSGALA